MYIVLKHKILNLKSIIQYSVLLKECKKMKNLKCVLSLRKLSLAIAALMAITFVSCSDDDLGPAPMVSVSNETSQNAVNTVVGTTITIEAAEGIKELIVLKNGVEFLTETFDGKKEATYEFQYTLTEVIGTVINFTFQVVDMEGRASARTPVFTVTVTAKPIRIIEAGNYLGEMTWYADTIYHLFGFVRIGSDVPQADGSFLINRGNNVLTIEPGTLIIGDKETKATLVVQRGAKIIADGTVDNPIVMTSEMPVGQRLPGDWGGLVVCGEVINNQGPNIELEGKYGAYFGGTVALDDASHSSGIIRYVRIEYAGVPINPNEEINTLTMGSVGKGTIIEYVQASYGLDDAFEWFGGSVDCKYLIAYRGLDDDFDVDFGYSGHVQFGIGIRDASLADQSGSNGFEVDNNGSGTAVEPFTSAAFSNITIIGPKKTNETPVNLQFQHAAQLRRASKLKIYNTFMTGYPAGLFIDDSRGNTSGYALSDELRVRNTILAGVANWGGNGYGSAYEKAVEGEVSGLPFGDNARHPNAPRDLSLKQSDTQGFNIVEWFNTPSFNNKRLASWTEAGIDPTVFDLMKNPKMTPNAGSMLLNAAKWDNIPEANHFEKVDFIGAFGDTDWTEGWAEFMPQTVVYY